MGTVLAYIVVLLMFAIATPILGLLASIPLLPLSMRFRAIAPAVTFLSSAAGGVASVFLAFWVLQKMSVHPTWLMFMLPMFLRDHAGRGRIAAARSGSTRVAEMAGEDFNSGLQVRMEWGFRLGDFAGIVIPLAARSLPFV